MNEDPYINCHTHIFTADHVPPLLAKTYVPWPWYFFIHLRAIVAVFRWWYKGPATLRYSVGYKRLLKGYTAVMSLLDRIYPIKIALGYYLFFFAFFLLYQLLKSIFPPDQTRLSDWVNTIYQLSDPIFPDISSKIVSSLVILLVLIFFESIRNFIFLIARLLWKVLNKLPGPQTKEMVQRYLNIGRYAFHKEQKTILSKLKAQYPKKTAFIVLPMDLEYMNAGHTKTRYRDQMLELAEVKAMPSNKNILYPFIFADPRRMVPVTEEKSYRKDDKPYFDWFIDNGKVKMNDCFIKDFIEEHQFSGIKIYPALGYYPFDQKLLPLWKYCADNDIPVLTHCIKGTIFYRGVKKQSWNEHPVFMQAMEKKDLPTDGYVSDEDMEEQIPETNYVPLVLSQTKNVAFSYNFTHPLNYLCILEEELLRKAIAATVSATDTKTEYDQKEAEKIKTLFGFVDEKTPLKQNLRNLKICLGHFGGEDEWKRYFEKDRYNYSSQLIKNPLVGIKFFTTVNNKPSKGKLEQIWKYTDWYSIICSMMLQYPKVYADISYILHGDRDILPLLKQTLENPKLKEKVVYGSDFFVVRNHKSDKHMLADMMGGLSEMQFDQIARKNPTQFLRNSLNMGLSTKIERQTSRN